MVTENIYKEAMLLQDACNPSGVAHTLSEVCSYLIMQEKADTDTVGRNPAVQLIMLKLADLTGTGCTCSEYMENWTKVFQACKSLAE